jgi:hypothetical protein
MPVSKQRQTELERLLRRLRQRAFSSDKAANLIPIVKARLMPSWDERARDLKHRRGQAMMQLWT